MENQASSNIDRESIYQHERNIDRNPNFDSDIVDSPTVTLTTPFPQSAIWTHAAALMKLQEQEREIKAQQRKIQELTFTLAIQDAHTQNIKASGSIPLTPSPPPLTTETPGPHRLQLKPERPEDIAYRAKLEKQKSAEKAMGQYKSPESPEAVLAAFQALLTVFKGKGRTQTGQSLHTLSHRKPKEPCSYGVPNLIGSTDENQVK